MVKRYLGAVALALALAIPAAAQERIAVLDTELPKGVDPKVVIPITEKVMEEFVRSKLFTVLDRAFINKTLSELEFSTSDLTAGDSEKLATIGGFLKATYIVVSTVQQLDRTYFLSAKMIEVKTGVITAQASVNEEGSLAVLIDMAGKLGRKLVAAAMGQDAVATTRPSERLVAAEASAPPSSAEAKPRDGGSIPQPGEASDPKRERFAVLSLEVGSGATVGYENGTYFNYYSWATDDTEAVSGLRVGASALFPIGGLYLSGSGSLTQAEFAGNLATVTSDTLALGVGLGLTLPLGPVQAFAGIRASYLAYALAWDFVSPSAADTVTDYSGPGLGFEVGADLRLGSLVLGLAFAIDLGSLSEDGGQYPNAEVAAGALSLRGGLAF